MLSDKSVFGFKNTQRYVNCCLKTALDIWKSCDFSTDLTVVYDDIYYENKIETKKKIESFVEFDEYKTICFIWNDENDFFDAKRHIWKSNKIDVSGLFKEILYSDMGGKIKLDCKIYIIDNKNDNVFFLYDDRGIDIFSNDIDYIEKLKQINSDFCAKW